MFFGNAVSSPATAQLVAVLGRALLGDANESFAYSCQAVEKDKNPPGRREMVHCFGTFGNRTELSARVRRQRTVATFAPKIKHQPNQQQEEDPSDEWSSSNLAPTGKCPTHACRMRTPAGAAHVAILLSGDHP
jgi:hypothetical protein